MLDILVCYSRGDYSTCEVSTRGIKELICSRHYKKHQVFYTAWSFWWVILGGLMWISVLGLRRPDAHVNLLLLLG